MTIAGGDFPGGAADFERFVREQSGRLQRERLALEEAERLVRLYGSNVRILLDEMSGYESAASRHMTSLFTAATVLYGIRHEMLVSPADYYLRRVPFLLFDMKEYERTKYEVMRLMKAELGWSDAASQAYLEDLEREAAQAAGRGLG